MNPRNWAWAARGGFIAAAVVLVIALISGIIATATSGGNEPRPSASANNSSQTATATATASSSAAVCDAKFVQVVANNNGDKVDGDFEQKYAAATSDAANLSDAQKQLLLTNSANNAQRLAIWSNAWGLYASPNNWQPLVDGNCLSAAGRDLYNQFAGALNAKGTTFAEGDAPENGYNTQVSSGTYQVFSAPGVSGNRKAIKVTLANGSVVWILVRCGNVVYSTPPPGVPTTTPPTTTPPTTPPTLEKKVPSQDPAAQGNAPVGGGKNIDPGPGVYVPPAQMSQPPAAPRVNPAPPVVVKAPPIGSVPDPVQPPPPQTAAPAPAAPATGCAAAPGTTC